MRKKTRTRYATNPSSAFGQFCEAPQICKLEMEEEKIWDITPSQQGSIRRNIYEHFIDLKSL
jgi:hypothetical protein